MVQPCLEDVGPERPKEADESPDRHQANRIAPHSQSGDGYADCLQPGPYGPRIRHRNNCVRDARCIARLDEAGQHQLGPADVERRDEMCDADFPRG